jgi:hypothetical protein
MAKALTPVEVMAPVTLVQAEKAASLLLTLQKMEKELTTRLKEWVRENGPIRVGDLIYGPNQVVSYDLNPEQITAVLLEAGLSREDIWPLLSITKTNLEKSLRKLRRRDLLDLALSRGTIEVSEKVGFRKITI